MPTIEVSFADLKRLLGSSLPENAEELTEILSYLKGEVELLEGDRLLIEMKDGNRPDLWSVEGIARGLKGILGTELGLKRYDVAEASGVEIFVDSRLENIRPFIACAVVKSVHLDGEGIRSLMRLQDKLDQTYGRRRRRASIGFYNFSLIKPPLHYKAVKPTEYEFIPLGFSKRMNLEEILENHPKGIEYGAIVRHNSLWPILVDDRDNVLSFPPIINSNDLGRIVEGEGEILVEVTGTSSITVLNTIMLVALCLADRGREILSARIHYPYGEAKEVVTPQLRTRTIPVSINYVNSVLGLSLNPEQAKYLLLRARYDAKVVANRVEVTVPCYRVDVMHPIDIVEDVAIVYGFDKIEPLWPNLATIGAVNRLEEQCDKVRELMVGLNFQEILSFSLTNPESQGIKMGLDSVKVVEVANPMSLRFTCLRSWLLPSLIEFISNNSHAAFPQRVFEVGDCIIFDEDAPNGVKEVRKLGAVISHPKASFSEAKSVVEAILRSLGFKPRLEEAEHPSFIHGRLGSIFVNNLEVGLVGEIHPSVLTRWGILVPTVGFEMDLSQLFSIIQT